MSFRHFVGLTVRVATRKDDGKAETHIHSRKLKINTKRRRRRKRKKDEKTTTETVDDMMRERCAALPISNYNENGFSRIYLYVGDAIHSTQSKYSSHFDLPLVHINSAVFLPFSQFSLRTDTHTLYSTVDTETIYVFYFYMRRSLFNVCHTPTPTRTVSFSIYCCSSTHTHTLGFLALPPNLPHIMRVFLFGCFVCLLAWLRECYNAIAENPKFLSHSQFYRVGKQRWRSSK